MNTATQKHTWTPGWTHLPLSAQIDPRSHTYHQSTFWTEQLSIQIILTRLNSQQRYYSPRSAIQHNSLLDISTIDGTDDQITAPAPERGSANVLMAETNSKNKNKKDSYCTKY